MKNLTYLFLFLFTGMLIHSCTQDNSVLEENMELEVESRDANVWICHKPNGNNPKALYVNENSANAHLGHGDVLLDADGDGYTAANGCGAGSQDDCDDNDASINPGVDEVCGDGIDNNCDGQIDEGCFGNCTLCNFISDLQDCNACWQYTGVFGCGDLGIFSECGDGYVNVDGCDWGCDNPLGGLTFGDAESNAACEAAIISALLQCDNGDEDDGEIDPTLKEKVESRLARISNQ